MDEWTIALYVTAVYAFVFVGLLCARQITSVLALFGILTIAYVHQYQLGVDILGDHMPHVFPGFALVLCAESTLRSASGHPNFDWKMPCMVLAPSFITLIIGQSFDSGHVGFKQFGHDFINICATSLAFSFGSESLAVRLGATRDTLDALQIWRAVLAPLSFASIGLVLMGHQHDNQEVAVAIHRTQGCLLLLLAVVSSGCSAVHLSGMPVSSRLCQFARALHSLMYLVNGCWLAQMGLILYIFPKRRGLHHLLEKFKSFGDPMPWEETSIYLAVTTWMCTCIVISWHMRHYRGTAAMVHAASKTRGAKTSTKNNEAGSLLEHAESDYPNRCPC